MALKKKMYVLAQVLYFHAFCTGMHEEEPVKGPKHIVFDFPYLVQPNIPEALKLLGLKNIFLSGVLGSISEEDTTQELFDVLNKVKMPVVHHEENKGDEDDGKAPEQRQELLYWRKKIVPLAMVAWFKNRLQSKEVLQATHDVIKQEYSRFTQGRMCGISTLVFDPDQCAQILEPRREIFSIVQKLQREGHTVHVLGNWPTDVKTSIQQRFHEDFSKINGQVAVSGDFDAIKCLGNTTIYQKFLSTFLPDVLPDDIVLVEQSENKEPWNKSLPIQIPKLPVVVAHPSNAAILHARLIRIGLLPEKSQI